MPAASASKVTNTDVLGAAKVAKNGVSSTEELVTGSGNGPGTPGAGSTVNSRPISTAVKAINNRLKESADRLDRTVKKITGTDQKKSTSTDAGRLASPNEKAGHAIRGRLFRC